MIKNSEMGSPRGRHCLSEEEKQKHDERQQSRNEFVDPLGAFGTFQSWKVQENSFYKRDSRFARMTKNSGSSLGMTGTLDSASSAEWQGQWYIGLLREARNDRNMDPSSFLLRITILYPLLLRIRGQNRYLCVIWYTPFSRWVSPRMREIHRFIMTSDGGSISFWWAQISHASW